MEGKNICFITQKFDHNDPFRANVIEWIRILSNSKKIKKLHILTRSKNYSSCDFNNCSISSIYSRNKIISLFYFYREIFKHSEKNSIIFIHQGGPYAINLIIFKILFGVKVFQWKAHPVIGPLTFLGFKFVVDKLFTCTNNSFPIKSSKKLVIGHGIDLKRFPIRKSFHVKKEKKLVTTSRISSRKNIHEMILLVKKINEYYPEEVSLTIFGQPMTKRDNLYLEYLNHLILCQNLSKTVEIKEPIAHKELHKELSKYNIYLNFSETALDKAVLEAMSIGLPILSNNECLRESLTNSELKESMLFQKNEDENKIIEKLTNILNFDNKNYEYYSSLLSAFVKNNHSIESLVRNIEKNIF